VIGYFARHFGADGESVRYDWLLVGCFAIPAIQLDAATATQQDLTIDFDRRTTGELMTYREIHKHT